MTQHQKENADKSVNGQQYIISVEVVLKYLSFCCYFTTNVITSYLIRSIIMLWPV